MYIGIINVCLFILLFINVLLMKIVDFIFKEENDLFVG